MLVAYVYAGKMTRRKKKKSYLRLGKINLYG